MHISVRKLIICFSIINSAIINSFRLRTSFRNIYTNLILKDNKSNMSNLIDGNKIAAEIRIELQQKVLEMKEKLGVTPGLAVILVGERRDSATYVRAKKKACEEVGIVSYGIDYPAEVLEEELIAKINELNEGKRYYTLISFIITKLYFYII